MNRTIYEAHCRDASQFSPAALAIDPLESPAILYPATHRNRLDRGDVADKLKVHGINGRKPPTILFGLDRIAHFGLPNAGKLRHRGAVVHRGDLRRPNRLRQSAEDLARGRVLNHF